MSNPTFHYLDLGDFSEKYFDRIKEFKLYYHFNDGTMKVRLNEQWATNLEEIIIGFKFVNLNQWYLSRRQIEKHQICSNLIEEFINQHHRLVAFI